MERVAEVTRLLSALVAPPTPLIDGYFLSEQSGDGALGPSDFREFYMLQVDRADLPQWSALLVPLASAPNYTAPRESPGWWLSPADFSALDFYAPAPLTGRNNGWIGVDADGGLIFIFTFTT
jgi:hypothetical protein